MFWIIFIYYSLIFFIFFIYSFILNIHRINIICNAISLINYSITKLECKNEFFVQNTLLSKNCISCVKCSFFAAYFLIKCKHIPIAIHSLEIHWMCNPSMVNRFKIYYDCGINILDLFLKFEGCEPFHMPNHSVKELELEPGRYKLFAA